VLNWSHEIDLALYLLGSAKVECAALRVRAGRVDIADIILRHDSGVISTIHLDYLSRPFVRRTQVSGDSGLITLNLDGNRFASAKSADGKIKVDYTNDTWDDNYVSEMQAFLRRAERKPAFGATASDGLAVLRICMEVLR